MIAETASTLPVNLMGTIAGLAGIVLVIAWLAYIYR